MTPESSITSALSLMPMSENLILWTRNSDVLPLLSKPAGKTFRNPGSIFAKLPFRLSRVKAPNFKIGIERATSEGEPAQDRRASW